MNTKKVIAGILILLAIISIIAVLVPKNILDGNSANDVVIDENKVTVSTSIFPLYDITSNIGGDRINLIQILPNGVSPHNYEPAPREVESVNESDIVFAIGHELDYWVEEIVADSEVISTVDEGILLREYDVDDHEEHEEEDHHDDHDEDEHHEEEDHHDDEEHENHHDGDDPHYWLSVENAKIISKNIKNNLSEIDPENADYYQENYEAYLQDLDELSNSIDESFSGKEGGIITFHDAFHYFADENGFEIYATIEPFPGNEPTAKYLEEVGHTIEEHDVQVMFNEPQLSDKNLSYFAEEFGVTIETIDPLGGVEERQSYIDLMKYNTDQISNNLD